MICVLVNALNVCGDVFKYFWIRPINTSSYRTLANTVKYYKTFCFIYPSIKIHKKRFRCHFPLPEASLLIIIQSKSSSMNTTLLGSTLVNQVEGSLFSRSENFVLSVSVNIGTYQKRGIGCSSGG